MPTVADEPRITSIVVDERTSCVIVVSVCVQRERDPKPIVLADKVPFTCRAAAYEFVQDVCGMGDAKINELPI